MNSGDIDEKAELEFWCKLFDMKFKKFTSINDSELKKLIRNKKRNFICNVSLVNDIPLICEKANPILREIRILFSTPDEILFDYLNKIRHMALKKSCKNKSLIRTTGSAPLARLKAGNSSGSNTIDVDISTDVNAEVTQLQ